VATPRAFEPFFFSLRHVTKQLVCKARQREQLNPMIAWVARTGAFYAPLF
jgi:hypothetical protein